MNTKIIDVILSESEAKQFENSYKDVIINNISFNRKLDLAGDRHSIDMEMSSDGAVTAESIKIYNILKISQRKLFEFFVGLGITASTFTGQEKVIATLGSLLAVIWGYKNVLLKKFNTQDSEVLFALYCLNGVATIDSIIEKYNELFNKNISDENLGNSLNLLADYQVISQLEDGRANIIEEITINKV